MLASTSMSVIAQESRPRLPPQPGLEPTLARVRDGASRLDTVALREVARSRQPDPWIVADSLAAQGELSVAMALAQSSDDAAVRDLPRYLKNMPNADADAALRWALMDTHRALRRRDLAGALLASSSIPKGHRSVTAIGLRKARSYALRQLHRPGACLAELSQAADAARAIGWLRQAQALLQQAGVTSAVFEKYEQADGLLRSAIELAVELKDRRAEGQSTGSLALTLSDRGRFSDAEQMFDTAIAIQKELDEPRDLARTMGNLGLVYFHRGQYERARTTQEQALAIARESNDQLGIAARLNALAAIAASTGRLAESLRLLQQSIAINRAVRHLPHLARGLHNLGSHHAERFELSEAKAAYRESIELSERIGNKVGAARSRAALGSLLSQFGEFGKAIELLSAATKTLEAGRVSIEASHANRALAFLLFRIGDVEGGLKCLGQATASFERAGEAAGAATARVQLAEQLSKAGEEARARSELEQAIEKLDALGRSTSLSKALSVLVRLELSSSNHEQAESVYQRLLSLEQAHGSQARVAQALALGGQVAMARNHSSDAASRFEHALAALEGPGAHPGTHMRVRHQLARMLLKSSRPADALGHMLAAIEHMEDTSSQLSLEESAGARDYYAPFFLTAYAAAIGSSEPRVLFRFLELARASALRSIVGRSDVDVARLATPADREALANARQLHQRARAELRQAISSGERTRVQRARRELESHRAEYARISREVRRRGRAAPLASSTLEDVQAVLRPNEVIAYPIVLQRRTFALVVERGNARIVELGSNQSLSPIWDARGGMAMRPPATEPRPADSRLDDPVGQIARAMSLNRECTHVFICPMGQFVETPAQLLFPERTVSCIPSASVLRHLRSRSASRISGTRVLALGDASTFDVSRPPVLASRVRGLNELTPLPGTKEEVQAIGDVVLTGKKATRTGLSVALTSEKQWRTVHFACHGVLDSVRPMLSFLVLLRQVQTTTA